MHHSRALVLVVVCLLGVATACSPGGSDDDAASGDQSGSAGSSVTPTATEPPPDQSPSEPSSADPTPSPTPSDDGTDPTAGAPLVDVPPLDQDCMVEPDQLPEIQTIRYAVPSAWVVEEGRCDLLDPDRDELPDQTEVDAAVSIDVAPVAFGVAADPSGTLTDVQTWVGARANLQTVRQTGSSTGAGLTPEGIQVLSWQFDLDAGTDAQGGVLTVSTDWQDPRAGALSAAVVDAIAQTVVIEPPAEGPAVDGPATSPGVTAFAVTRVEGGGTPYTVTYDGECFRLRPGGPTDDARDELCDLEPTDDLAAGVLGDGVVVGYTSPLAVTVNAPDVDGPDGLASPIPGSSVFAFQVGADRLPTMLVARGREGGELAVGDVG